MPDDWNDADRLAAKRTGLWAAVVVGGLFERGLITEVGNTEVALCLALGAAWFVFAGWVIAWTFRTRKRG